MVEARHTHWSPSRRMPWMPDASGLPGRTNLYAHKARRSPDSDAEPEMPLSPHTPRSARGQLPMFLRVS